MDWRILEHRERIDLGKAGDAKMLDLHIRMGWQDLDPELGPDEVRKMAFRQLKRILQKWKEEEWVSHTTLSNPVHERPQGPDEGPYHVRPERKREAAEFQWQAPDLPAADLQACHQFLEALLLLGVHGRAVSTGDIIKKRKMGARALYRILQQDSNTYEYLRPFIHDMKSRGRRLLDLTPEGKMLASKIRAGTITV